MSTTLPFMSLRGHPLFPGNPCILEIGRAFTIASIKKSIESYGGTIVIAAQKTIEMNDRPDLGQVFTTGCVCKIENHTEFPDGMMKVKVISVERFLIEDLQDVDGVRYCKGETIPNTYTEQNIEAEKKKLIAESLEKTFANEKSEVLRRALELLRKDTGTFDFVSKAGYLLSFQKTFTKKLTVEQMNAGIFVIDTYTPEEKSLLNMNVARVQEILEAQSFHEAMKKLEALVL